MQVIKENLINSKAPTACSLTNRTTSSARITPPSSPRARPRSTPNTTKRTTRGKQSKVRSSTTPSRSSTATSPSSPCRASSTASKPKVNPASHRTQQIRGGHHRRRPVRQWTQNHPIHQIALRSQDCCGQRYPACRQQTHERQLRAQRTRPSEVPPQPPGRQLAAQRRSQNWRLRYHRFGPLWVGGALPGRRSDFGEVRRTALHNVHGHTRSVRS